MGNDGCTYSNYYQGVDCGYNITAYSEMAHLLYVTLGDKAYYSTSGVYQPGYGLSNTGPFSNLFPDPMYASNNYWSDAAYPPGGGTGCSASYPCAFYFNFDWGSQSYDYKTGTYYAWAVHPGDVGTAVATVPVPAAALLFGSGLFGLLGSACRRKTSK